MTNLYSQWDSISTKIKSLVRGGEFFFQTLISSSDGKEKSLHSLFEDSKATLFSIKKFRDDFLNVLPIDTVDYMNKIFKQGCHIEAMLHADGKGAMLQQFTSFILLQLSIIEANISLLLCDTQTRIRKTVELAVAHLQRIIVADPYTRRLWEDGWVKGKDGKPMREEYFEGLGSNHLLMHKILAFKINSSGERTDLVFSELSIDQESSLLNSVDGLVLTEWKKVDCQKNLSSQIEAAKSQADRYSKGSLLALELSNYRYLVMVSPEHLYIPPEQSTFQIENIVYRVINIACTPKTPSRS